jgi:Flp pilus assembly pilin Flp
MGREPSAMHAARRPGAIMFHLRRGSTQTEYVLIAAVISVAILTGVTGIGGSLEATFTSISDILSAF